MIVRIITKENRDYYEEFLPADLKFLLYMEEHVVLGMMEEKDGKAFTAGVCILSFDISDAVMVEWLYVEPEHRGRGYGTEVLLTVQELARKNGRTRIMAKLWGKAPGEGVSFLTDSGFVPSLTEQTDEVYRLMNLVSNIENLRELRRESRRKAGFELEKVADNAYIPRIYGTPEREILKKAMAAALYETAKGDSDLSDVVFVRCAPWEDISVIKEFFEQKPVITSVCYEIGVDYMDQMEAEIELEESEEDAFLREMDSIPTEFVMTGLEEY